MSLKIRSFARRLSAAVRVAAGGSEAASDKRATSPKNGASKPRDERDAALRNGIIEQDAVQVELDAARLASDAGETALAQILSDSDPSVRARAIGAIVAFSGRYATRLLRALIYDPDASVRRLAVAAAPRVEGSGVMLSLIVALGDPDASVRKAAAHALASITQEPVALDPKNSSVSPARVARLKQGWKERRRAELEAELTQEPSAQSIR